MYGYPRPRAVGPLQWGSACLLLLTACGAPSDDAAAHEASAPIRAQAGTDSEVGESGEVPATDPPSGGTTCTAPQPKPGDTACTAPIKPGDDRLCEYAFNGKQRKFYLYAPPSFDPCKPASLIVDNHGLSESTEVHIGRAAFSADRPKGYGSGWRRAVQGDNVIVVTPQGINNSWNAANDVPFLNDIATKVEQLANVDPEKVYVTGISMGGMMTFATACADTKRWRGMSSIATLSTACPRIARPLPLISFHSETDQLTSYAGDRKGTEAVAKLNNCKRGPTPLASFGGPNSSPLPFCFKSPPKSGSPDAADPYAVPMAACPSSAKESTCIQWDQCDEDVKVVFCTVSAATQTLGGHLLYSNDTGLNVAVMSWDFLKQFWK
jgi:hypothetical protein